jgi:hypothetical protein
VKADERLSLVGFMRSFARLLASHGSLPQLNDNEDFLDAQHKITDGIHVSSPGS